MADLIRNYGADIDWNIGSLFCHESVTRNLIDICKFYNVGHNIRYAFGSIPSLMSGGRVPPKEMSIDDAIASMEWHIKNDIACRLTLSNPHLTEDDIESDEINAELMKWLNENQTRSARNGIILSSDILARHARRRYPDLDVILSILRPAYETGYGRNNDTFEWYAKKLDSDLYDLVVVNGAKLYEDNFMESLPHKEKVELIACHDCVRNCPRAKAHYEGMLMQSLAMNRGDSSAAIVAQAKCRSVLTDCRNWKRLHPMDTAAYSEDEIRKLVELGYRHFKIAGRTASDDKFKFNLMQYVFKNEVMHYLESAFS